MGGVPCGKRDPSHFISMYHMAKPIAIISTDRHLKDSNAIGLIDLAEQEIALAGRLGIKQIIWLGDMFDSRIGQRQELLTCMSEMIDMYASAGLQIMCIPGNHDKTDYTLDDSFLSTYRYHPGFTLFEEPRVVTFEGVEMHFVPFYEQETWVERFKWLPKPLNKNSVLFSHTAVSGSINNDGKVVENKISLKMFSGYGKVFLGHYHNAQQPGRNVFHLPSVQQNNFGEDEDKGFTVLYDDLSFELVKSHFTPYRTIRLNIAALSPEEVVDASKKINTDDQHLRVTLIGDQQSVKSINKKLFTDRGAVVEVKYTDVEVGPEAEEERVVRKLSGTDIAEKFKEFCSEKGYNYAEGFGLLKEIMKWQDQEQV